MLFGLVWFLVALFQVSVLSRGWGGGSVKTKIKLISANPEAKGSSLSLAKHKSVIYSITYKSHSLISVETLPAPQPSQVEVNY